MSPNSPSMTSMPVALVKGLKACFRNASETEPPHPSKRMDLAAQALLTAFREGRPDQPDGGAGQSEVFEKVTPAELSVAICVVYPIQFFFRYDGHWFSFQVMVVRLIL
jgi:hypothetical protein